MKVNKAAVIHLAAEHAFSAGPLLGGCAQSHGG